MQSVSHNYDEFAFVSEQYVIVCKLFFNIPTTTLVDWFGRKKTRHAIIGPKIHQLDFHNT